MPTNTLSRAFLLESGPSAQLRFAGPKATSQWVVLPVIGFLSLNASSVTADDTLQVFLLRLVADAAAFIVAWIIFVGMGALIQRFLPEYGRARIVALTVMNALTEMGRTTTGFLVTISFGIPEEADWAFRLSAAAMTGIVFFGFASTLVNDSALYRDAYTELATARLRLEVMLSTSQSALIATRERIISRVRAQLESALRASIDESERQNPRLALITENLFSAVDVVVRPVSHELFGHPINLQAPEIPVTPPRLRIKPVFEKATQESPIKAGAFSLIALLLTAPFFFFKSDIGAVSLRYVTSTFVLFALLFVAGLLLNRVLSRLTVTMRLLIVLTTYGLVSAVYTVVFAAEAVSDPSRGPLIILYGYGLGAILGGLIALTTGMHALREEMLADLAAKNQELAWLNARLQSELWSDQKKLALNLHNNVQGTLLAAALKLRSISEAASRKPELTDVRLLVEQAINFEFSQDIEKTLEQVVVDVQNAWSELITMDFEISPDTYQAVNSDPVLVRTVADVVSEFTTNSIKHGAAKKMKVVVTGLDNRRVHIVLRNDGKPQKAGATEGMGTSFMKSVAIASEILTLPTGFGVSLVLPLEPASESTTRVFGSSTRA